MLALISLLFMSQSILAKSKKSLSSPVRLLLESGRIFELGLPTYTQMIRHFTSKRLGQKLFLDEVLLSLEEIDSHLNLVEEAKEIVSIHSPDYLGYLDSMLDFYRLIEGMDHFGTLSRSNRSTKDGSPYLMSNIQQKYEAERSHYIKSHEEKSHEEKSLATYRHLIESGDIFRLGLPYTTAVENETFLRALKEVNSTPSRTEETRSLVKDTHGNDRLLEFDLLLELQNLVELQRLDRKLGIISNDDFISKVKDRVSPDAIQRLERIILYYEAYLKRDTKSSISKGIRYYLKHGLISLEDRVR